MVRVVVERDASLFPVFLVMLWMNLTSVLKALNSSALSANTIEYQSRFQLKLLSIRQRSRLRAPPPLPLACLAALLSNG